MAKRATTRMRQKLLKGIQNPQAALRFTRQFLRGEMYYRLRRINQWYHRQNRGHDGYDLVAADWDTAIILDACRYDTFAKCNRYDGNLRREVAVGSESREFFQRVFQDDTFHDTVYVTGNPYITILEDDTFHDVYIDEAWNTAGTAAAPGRMTDAAIRAHEDHPDKRVVVHYMQPHLPIIAPGWEHVNEDISYYKDEYFPDNGLSIEKLYQAYKANLRYVLDHVDELLAAIEGKVLITSDHGELLGERQRPIPIRGFNHHENLYVDGLLSVPWLEIENGPRREIHPDPPAAAINVDDRAKQEQLRALGYL